MAEIKSLSAIKDKWTRVTPGRTTDYKLGIENPKRDWAATTVAAEANYALGVTQAQGKGLFKKGVERAGTKKWQKAALLKGPGRFAEGVTLAGNDYEAGFKPYHDVISRTELPPRFPKRDPRNLERVRKIVTALIEAKVG